MKKALRTLLISSVVLCGAFAEHEGKRGTEADVVVTRLEESIPVPEREAEKFVWDRFSKRPEIRLFRHYSTQGWRMNFDLFSSALVAAAKKEGLEYEALDECLKKLLDEPVMQEPGEIAYLPIGAYRTRRGTQEAWVILCLWEMAVDPSKMIDLVPPDVHSQPAAVRAPTPKPEWLTVGHVRILTYDIGSKQLIGYVTCD